MRGVRRSPHSHLSIAVRKFGEPFDRIEPIICAGFVVFAERSPGFVAAADVLQRDHVSMLRKVFCLRDESATFFVVWSSLQQDGQAIRDCDAVSRRSLDIRGQFRPAIASRDHDILAEQESLIELFGLKSPYRNGRDQNGYNNQKDGLCFHDHLVSALDSLATSGAVSSALTV